MSSTVEEIGERSALGEAYLAGELRPKPITGEFRPSRREDAPRIESAQGPEQRRWTEGGMRALRAGEVAFGVLAAGASTRMNLADMPEAARRLLERTDLRTVTSKALVPVCELDGEVLTFLDLFAGNVRRLNEAVRSTCPMLLLASEANAGEIEGHLRDRHPGVSTISFRQTLDRQIVATPQDVERARKNFSGSEEVTSALRIAVAHAGCDLLVPKPAGHGEFLHQLISSGTLGRLLDLGVRYFSVRNIDNVGGALDARWLAMLGRMIERDRNLTLEVSRRPDGPAGKGGALIVRPGGDFQIAEDPTLDATGVSPRDSYYLNDATAIFSADYLLGIYETSAAELRASSAADLAAIAAKGRRKFPPLIDVKPVRLPGDRVVGAFIRETSLWESTGVEGARPIDTVAVDSVKDAEPGYERLSPGEQRTRALSVRFLATKKWEDYEGINAQLLPHLARRVLKDDLLERV